MAPEYATRGYLTEKADVYSFGVVTLEIITGKSVMSYRKDAQIHLVDLANSLRETGRLLELVDERLEMEFDKEEAMGLINVALLCTDLSSTRRPMMSAVVSMLNSGTDVPDFVPKPDSSNDDLGCEIRGEHCEQSKSSDHSPTRGLLVDGAPYDSTTSASDLYPINPDSQYWSQRD